jgi:hypothetical protein
MRHQWHDDEVYLQRERHSISLGHSQRHMQIAFFMASIIRKAFRHGFHRPTTKDDAMETVTECRDCQFFFRSKLRSIQILFYLSISPSLSQSRESILWVLYPGHQLDSDFYSSP